MPKLMIDLASPSTGGSTDVVAAATKQATHASSAKKDAIKSNLARAAKNSAANRVLSQSSKVSRHHGTSTAQMKGERVTLKKQMISGHFSAKLVA